MFLTSLLAWIFFDLDTNAVFFAALLICSGSIIIYYGVCEKDENHSHAVSEAGESVQFQAVPTEDIFDEHEEAISIAAEYGEFHDDEDE